MPVDVTVHVCGQPILVAHDGPLSPRLYLDRHERPITHCPRCRRRLVRSKLAALDRDTRGR